MFESVSEVPMIHEVIPHTIPIFSPPIKPLQYKILSHIIVSKLSDNVNEYLQDGWYPLGGLLYAGTHFYQAMMK